MVAETPDATFRELVSVVVTVESSVGAVAPPAIKLTSPVPSAPAEPIVSAPLLTVAPPVKLLAPDRVTEFTPASTVIAPAPVMLLA